MREGPLGIDLSMSGRGRRSGREAQAHDGERKILDAREAEGVRGHLLALVSGIKVFKVVIKYDGKKKINGKN